MNHIIQTGTDSEGNAVTTTLDVQFTFTYEYAGHETQNFVNNQEMPRRRENDMVKTVSVKVTGTDSTTANASHLVDGQVDQTYSETFSIPLYIDLSKKKILYICRAIDKTLIALKK